MNYTPRLIFFLILNFGALAVGGWLMGDAVMSEWYNNLNKAPWTPPGWVFGAAWTVVMIAFSIFMAGYTGNKTQPQKFFELNPMMILYLLQWVLNVSWNFVFFNQKLIMAGFAEILLLLALTAAMMYTSIRERNSYGWWMLPYVGWLAVAVSLNGYILMYN